MLASILEEIKINIPDNIQKIIKTKAWREAQPADTFLDPKGLTFPVKFEGKFRCDMIHAAIVFSAIFSKKGSKNKKASFYKDIHNQAKALSVERKCNTDKHIKLNEDDSVSIVDLFEVYTLGAISEMRILIEEDS